MTVELESVSVLWMVVKNTGEVKMNKIWWLGIKDKKIMSLEFFLDF